MYMLDVFQSKYEGKCFDIFTTLFISDKKYSNTNCINYIKNSSPKSYIVMLVFSIIFVILCGPNLKKSILKLAAAKEAGDHSFPQFEALYPFIIYGPNYYLNIDILNDKYRTGAGWDQFHIPDTTSTTFGKQILLRQSIDKTKKIKAIIILYAGSEIGNGRSTVSLQFTGTDNEGSLLGSQTGSSDDVIIGSDDYSQIASIETDKTNLNFIIYGPPLCYPVTLSSVFITLNNKSSSCTIKGGVICISYCDDTDAPNIKKDNCPDASSMLYSSS